MEDYVAMVDELRNQHIEENNKAEEEANAVKIKQSELQKTNHHCLLQEMMKFNGLEISGKKIFVYEQNDGWIVIKDENDAIIVRTKYTADASYGGKFTIIRNYVKLTNETSLHHIMVGVADALSRL